jgi:hypothetical protein
MVPVDRLLLGGQNSLTAAEYAEVSGDLLWASTPVARGPHAELLRDAAERELTEEELLASRYAAFARTVIAETGNFFTAQDDQGIVDVARGFIQSYGERSEVPDRDRRPVGVSRPGVEIRVAHIRHSDCFQVIDGHHRVASRAVGGDELVRVRAGWVGVTTPLQDTLDSMTWIGGQRELYQPLDAPELARSWVTVRKCTDRLEKMKDFLATVPDLPAAPTYLDVASCYGWFVAKMQDAGFDGYGVERDPLGPLVGQAAYGLDPVRIHVGDAVEFLESAGDGWDVISCLSLLHHFALGRASRSADEFLRLVDRATRHVLILDTGQSHEEWLVRRLPGWDTEDIIRRLKSETTFDRVVDLGPDEDAVGPYAHNYGRHLFACVRS